MSSKIKITPTLAPLPTNFKGKPQAFAEAIVARLKFVTDDEFTTFVISDSLPANDQGPVLLGGTKWYVWNPDDSEYVPLDISDSFTPPFQVSSTTPVSTVPPVWLRITALTGGRVIGWYYFMGEDLGWVPGVGIVPSGTTAERPALPLELERFYDTDINTEIWWERGSWRTVAGGIGDLKYTIAETLDEALEHNPGWVEAGTVLGSVIRGRALIAASKDPAASEGVTNLPVGSGITSREAGESFGEETHEIIEGELPEHHHKMLNNQIVGDSEVTDPTEDDSIARRKAGSSAEQGYRLIGRDFTEFPPELGKTSEVGASTPMNVLGTRYAAWLLVKT
jgi:hypothetical protein